MILKDFTKLFLISLSFTLVLGISHKSFGADATLLQKQIEQVNKEREALIAEQEKLERELEIVNKEAKTLGGAVNSLDATRKKIQADINITQSKINSTNLNIQSLENSMTKKESQIVVHRKAISDALQALSEYSSRSWAFDLLASASISDVWRDRSQVEGLTGKLEEEIDFLRETKTILSKEKEAKEKVVDEQARLKAELGGQKSVVEENKKAKETLLAQTKNKEAEYQKLLQDNIARQKQSESDLFRLESELQIALDPSLIPKAKHSVLSWPLDKIYITGVFGTTVGGLQLYKQGFHNGVDFRASQGTKVKAVLSGTVEGTGNTDEQKGCYSYGRWILIKHNNGLTSVYAHLSATVVKAGQTVATGQTIGYSGGQPGVFGSGYSTGPHLHLGLFASQGVEIRQFTTSIGCKQVSVPISKGTDAYLDPLAYLPAL